MSAEAAADRARRATGVACALFALTGASSLYLIGRRVGFSYLDEGYLWYGTQAVLRGELPLRDFNSYDPGRYLWCAAWALLCGPGIVAVRLACWLFGALGLFAGLRVASRVHPGPLGLALATVVLGLWMQPTWKLFESSLAMIAVLVGTRLLEHPSRGRHLLAGAFAGLAACVGRNHGVYVTLALSALIVIVALRAEPRALARRLAAFGGGVALGYAPVLLLVLFAPRFGAMFLESVSYFAQQGHLGLKRPVPWPWIHDYAALDAWEGVHDFAVGCGYLLLPLAYLPGLVGLARTRAPDLARRAPWLAACAVGIPYVHHASVHAAYNHLAQAIHPALLALLVVPVLLSDRRALRVLLPVGLVALALAANVPRMEAVKRLRFEGTRYAYRSTRVGRDELWLPPEQAVYIRLLRGTLRRSVPPAEPVFLAPVYPGLYAMLERRAPTWDVYMAWRGTSTSQARLVRELGAVEWALVSDVSPGGQDWMRLRNTNPLAWELFEREFEDVSVQPRLPAGHRLLRRRP